MDIRQRKFKNNTDVYLKNFLQYYAQFPFLNHKQFESPMAKTTLVFIVLQHNPCALPSSSTGRGRCAVPSRLYQSRGFDSFFTHKKQERLAYASLSYLAEKEGFEPSRLFCSLHDFQSCALGRTRRLLQVY